MWFCRSTGTISPVAPPDTSTGGISVAGFEQPPAPTNWRPLVLVGLVVAVLLGVVAAADRAPMRTDEGPDDENLARRVSFDVSPASDADDRIVLVRSPVGLAVVPAKLTVVRNGGAFVREFDLEIYPGFGRADMPAGRRIQIVGDEVVFLSRNELTAVNTNLADGPVELGEASHLLPGSAPGHVWAVGSGSRTVRDVEVAGRTSTTYDMVDAGVPLDSYGGGLVLSPADRSFGRVAVWSPETGVAPIVQSDDTSFVGAGRTKLIFVGPGRLATFDTATGESTVVDSPVGDVNKILTEVSPDGSYLAVVYLRSPVELPLVNVLDTSTGVVVDALGNALTWQLQWINDHEIMFIRLDGDAYRFVARNVRSGIERDLIEVAHPAYLVAADG